MSAVIDASVAVKWAVEEEGSDAASAFISAGEPLIAPQFLMVESANVLWKKVLRGELDQAQAVAGLALIRKTFPALIPDADLLPPAFAIAVDLSHPVYDCLYVACAERSGWPLITADKRLHEKARGRLGNGIRLLGYPASTRSG